MQNSESQAKQRYSIFKNKLFPDSPTFKKVPLHFDFTPTVTCVFDHSNQTINTYSNKFKRPKRAESHHKIFGARRTVSQQKSALSSAEQTSRCASFCGEKRSHSIFSKPKKVRFSSEESLKENQKQTIEVKMMKTQSQPQNQPQRQLQIQIQSQAQPQRQQICLAKAVTNHQQIQRFYREQLQQKLRVRQQQKVFFYYPVQTQPKITQAETFDVLKPQQFAKMIKQVRMATKYKRNQVAFKPLHEVTHHQNFYMAKKSANSREALIYRI